MAKARLGFRFWFAEKPIDPGDQAMDGSMEMKATEYKTALRIYRAAGMPGLPDELTCCCFWTTSSPLWKTETSFVSPPHKQQNAELFIAHLDDLQLQLRGYRKIHVILDYAVRSRN